MPCFDTQTLQSLKKLCRIDCSPSEEEALVQNLQRVIDYVTQLSEVDTEGVEPCNSVLESLLKNQMRQDVVTNTLSREAFLNNAPDQIGGMIRVPPVLKPPQ